MIEVSFINISCIGRSFDKSDTSIKNIYKIVNIYTLWKIKIQDEDPFLKLSFYQIDAMVEEKSSTGGQTIGRFCYFTGQLKTYQCMQRKMSKDWFKRYQDTQDRQLHDIVSFLDPRFQNSKHCRERGNTG